MTDIIALVILVGALAKMEASHRGCDRMDAATHTLAESGYRGHCRPAVRADVPDTWPNRTDRKEDAASDGGVCEAAPGAGRGPVR